MERIDSETHSFSHCPIMTRAIERTDSEIVSFSHRVIMTRVTERTDSEKHAFCGAILKPLKKCGRWGKMK